MISDKVRFDLMFTKYSHQKFNLIKSLEIMQWCHISFRNQLFNHSNCFSKYILLCSSWLECCMQCICYALELYGLHVLILSILFNIPFKFSTCFKTFDLSIGSTETKYIKLNTETQNIWQLFYTLWQGGQENRRRKKSFLI